MWTFWLLVCLQQDPRQPEIPWGFLLTRWNGNKRSMDNLKQNSSPAHRPKTKKGNQTFWLVDESSITANKQSRQAFCTCEAPAKNKLISSWFDSQNKMYQFLTTMHKSYHTTQSVAVIPPQTKTTIREWHWGEDKDHRSFDGNNDDDNISVMQWYQPPFHSLKTMRAWCSQHPGVLSWFDKESHKEKLPWNCCMLRRTEDW